MHLCRGGLGQSSSGPCFLSTPKPRNHFVHIVARILFVSFANISIGALFVRHAQRPDSRTRGGRTGEVDTPAASATRATRPEPRNTRRIGETAVQGRVDRAPANRWRTLRGKETPLPLRVLTAMNSRSPESPTPEGPGPQHPKPPRGPPAARPTGCGTARAPGTRGGADCEPRGRGGGRAGRKGAEDLWGPEGRPEEPVTAAGRQDPAPGRGRARQGGGATPECGTRTHDETPAPDGAGVSIPLWQVKDSNLRRLSRRIYSPLPLAARATCLGCGDGVRRGA